MNIHNQKKDHNKLIFWDIDGTLMHCGSDGTKALNSTFQELYGIENAFTKVGIGSAMDAVILSRIMEAFQLDKEGLDQVKEVYPQKLRAILDDNSAKIILPGVTELLEAIKDSGHLFNAILTSNLRMGAEIKLASVGLSHYFKVGGFGDHYGEKWHAAEEGIQEAEAYFGTTFLKENIFIIGDSPYDIECAKKLGIVSVGVATGWVDYDDLKSRQPDYLYKDLSDWRSIYSIFDVKEREK